MGQVFEDGLGAWEPIGRFPWVRPLQRRAMLVALEEGVLRPFRNKVVPRLYVLAMAGIFLLEGEKMVKIDFVTMPWLVGPGHPHQLGGQKLIN